VRTEYEKVNDEKGKSQFRPKKNQFGADLRHPLWNKHEFNPATNMWEPKDMVSSRYIGQVAPTIDENTLSPAVSFQLKGEGATQFADLTGNNIGQPLAIVLDDDVMEVANIKDKISGTCQKRSGKDEDARISSRSFAEQLPTKPTLPESTVARCSARFDQLRRGHPLRPRGRRGVMAIYYLLGGMIANLALVM
jgi:SecD/SecF fusion protein